MYVDNARRAFQYSVEQTLQPALSCPIKQTTTNKYILIPPLVEVIVMQAIRKAVIPIAGYGTRVFPASKVCMKAAFPVPDYCSNNNNNNNNKKQVMVLKPVIFKIVEEALSVDGVEVLHQFYHF
jgi:hypothetical protein